MAEIGHSRNAIRGAKNDTLVRVAEVHVVESALLKAKVDRYIADEYFNNFYKPSKYQCSVVTLIYQAFFTILSFAATKGVPTVVADVKVKKKKMHPLFEDNLIGLHNLLMSCLKMRLI